MPVINFNKGFIEILGIKIQGEQITNIAMKAVWLIGILIIAKIIIKVGSIIIEKFFTRQKNSRFGVSEKKADTLSELLKSILKYIMYLMALMWMLAVINPGIAITFTGVVGVFGVAVGFGAQNLVKDIIGGFFILFEDQFAVGDYIEINGKSGIVEALAIRITKIRDFSGDLYIIPNGSITGVTNKSRGSMRAKVDVQIAYESDIEKAIDILKKVGEQIGTDMKDIIVEGPDVLGVTSLGESGINITVIAKALAMQQWAVERELMKKIKYAFDKEGIEIPYPKRVIINEREEVKA